MTNELSIKHHSGPSGSTSRISSRLLRALFPSRMFVEISVKLVIPTWLGNIFKSMVFSLLENVFTNHKIESRHFYSCAPTRQNFRSGSYHCPR